MKPKRQNERGLAKLDTKEKKFLKNYGQLHPINEIEYLSKN
jgi:hypothetical protein